MVKLGEQPGKQWESLVSAAVLGLDRTRRAGTGPGQDGQRDFFEELCVLSLYTQAGRTAAKCARDEKAAFEEEEVGGSGAAACLREIFSGEYKGLLPEWCAAACRLGRRAPPECLPDLLEYARSVGPQEQSVLQKVVGGRGMWLARQNPAWRNLFAEAAPDEGVWHTGTRQERLHLLNRLRLKGPARALALLRQTWQQEDPDDRALFVEALATRLSGDDEVFLEECLDDKRKPVRAAAADLLARLPGSQLARRMTDSLFQLIRYTAGKKGWLRSRRPILEVELPDVKDRTLLRDGIDPRKVGQLGPAAIALARMVAAVPLEAWKRLDSDVNDIIASALAGEFGAAFALGFCQATVRQQSAEWAKAIVGCYHLFRCGGGQAGGIEIDLMGMMKCLAPEERETVVADYAEHHGESQDLHLVHELLVAMDHQWSDTFSRKAFHLIRKHFIENLGNYSLRRPVVEKFALRLSPVVAEEAGQGWPTPFNRFTSGDEEMVHRLMSILKFRQRMLEELNRGY